MNRFAALRLDSFGIAFREKIVMDGIDLSLPHRGISVLMGPAGGGKSALLRTLAGANDGLPEMRCWGEISVGELSYHHLCRLPFSRRPTLVRQHVRFYLDTVRENLVSALPNRAQLSPTEQTDTIFAHLESLGISSGVDLTTPVGELSLQEQRRLAIARALLNHPPILFVDEPTVGLRDTDAARVLALLQVAGQRCSVLVATHHPAHARALDGPILLLAGGRIVETNSANEFFEQPRTSPGRSFVRTGRCDLRTPSSTRLKVPWGPEERAHLDRRPGYVTSTRGPRGFHWVLPGILGGTARPGLVDPLEADIDGLVRLGVTLLVSLEERKTVPERALATQKIASQHFPIEDEKAPTVEDALWFCAHLESAIRGDETIALHCQGGLGRTTTMLCCQLIWRGRSACEALERVRLLKPRSVESDEQIAFLSEFESAVIKRRTSPPPRSRVS